MNVVLISWGVSLITTGWLRRMGSCGVDNFSNRVVAERMVFRQRAVAERMVWWMHGELIGTPRKLVDE